ncbi:cytochrome-c peroxidase [Xylophilus rhododendri]|uniref:Cytochrome-c peroxidase n=1 Tax=Xylophilus rhododendri TaxID=2697032 RepID=A0A857J6U6_9BURK|nr:cytochrome c peroxidase [Xylophilus rhododendri]QHI98799.1 cytochrome-c peroxidase [Xylophilus rhododendri]
MPNRRLLSLLPVLFALALHGCQRPAEPAAAPAAPAAPVAQAKPPSADATYALTLARQPSAAEMAAVGRAMFSDKGLSASGQMSCASCHSPQHAYGPPNALSVQLGGPDGQQPGVRAVPSLRYVQTVTAFSEHHFDNDGDDSVDAGPTGGHTWDGRADSTHAQSAVPLLSAYEMANASPAAVVAKLRQASYAGQFRATFGQDIFDDEAKAFRWAGMALEVFQETPEEFYPFDSKFDAVLRKQAKFTPQEARGLALFEDEKKGNCASCHISRITPDGGFPLFSDFGLIAIGVPRNAAIPANADPAYFDLGLCGPLRTDLKDRPEYCGLFRTPSLRNVATRQVFMHNGVFHSLDEVLRFYVQRDTHPGRFYPRGKDGKPAKFDDLPARYHANLNTDAPFDGRRPGQRPVWSEADIRDVVVFLKTLNDGWHPP